MTVRVFERMDHTTVEFDGTGLRIAQTVDGNEEAVWIPARYVPEFLSEMKRAAEGPLVAPSPQTVGLQAKKAVR